MTAAALTTEQEAALVAAARAIRAGESPARALPPEFVVALRGLAKRWPSLDHHMTMVAFHFRALEGEDPGSSEQRRDDPRRRSIGAFALHVERGEIGEAEAAYPDVEKAWATK